MIVKVQQSLAGNNPNKSCLIYDRSRKIFYETDDAKEVEPLVKLLGDRPKAYFHAELSKEGKIVVKKEAPTQTDW